MGPAPTPTTAPPAPAPRPLLALLAGVAAVGLLAGCGGTASDAQSGDVPGSISRANKDIVETVEHPHVGGQLVYGLTAETNGWNPASNQWAVPGQQVSRAIFDT